MATAPPLIRDFWQENKYLAKTAFIKSHPHPFIVDSGQAQLGQPLREFETLQSSDEADREAFKALVNVTGDSRIFPVRKQGTGGFADKITLGRTANNDVVIEHHAVSKLHAFFSRDEETGDLGITDVNSMNGVLVNGRTITPMAREPLANGDVISLGKELSFVYLLPRDLFSRMRILDRFTR